MLLQKERVESEGLAWRRITAKKKMLSQKERVERNRSVRRYYPKITSATHLITSVHYYNKPYCFENQRNVGCISSYM